MARACRIAFVNLIVTFPNQPIHNTTNPMMEKAERKGATTQDWANEDTRLQTNNEGFAVMKYTIHQHL